MNTRRLFKRWYRKDNLRHWVGILALTAVSVGSMNLQFMANEQWMASILDLTQHAPFDGTVAPIEYSPNWVKLTLDEFKASYKDIPANKFIALPEYDKDVLSQEVKWGDAGYNAVLTYPVPYLGNYQLDQCGERCGSHAGVDIKVPEGTPVLAIANAVVEKISDQASGFGKHVVLKHVGVPDPNNPGKITTLYSSYSHLSEIDVTEDTVVAKGDVIGKSGRTGTATTPHVHFQLDTEDAPFHVYWPFTSKEAQLAKVDFFDAVNVGLGKDNAIRYTANPMDFVQDNLNASTSSDSASTSSEDSSDATPSQDSDTSSDSNEADVSETAVSSLDLDYSGGLSTGGKLEVNVQALDSDGNLVKKPSFNGQLTLSVSDDSVAKLNKSYLKASDFKGGQAALILFGEREGSVTLGLELEGKSYFSDAIPVQTSIEPFNHFELVTDGSIRPNEEERIQIQAMDSSGNATSDFAGVGKVELSLVRGEGEFSQSKILGDEFINGLAEVSFVSSSEGDVSIQLEYGRQSDQVVLSNQLFSDLDEANPSFPAVSYLFKKGTVSGYPDGSFQPEKTVSRVELLKLAYSGFDQEVRQGLQVNFSDTQNGTWYSDFLGTAYEQGVVQGYNDGSFKPEQGVNRVEALKMALSLADVSIDPVVSENPYKDVDSSAWFAPYVAFAKAKNLLPVDGKNFEPDQEMSRQEVAELIYRLNVVLQNDGESYSVLLEVN